ncbi:hypothetical protein [Sphingomonas sp. AX6]|uniref:hypothetical protein n=1 Tax=Sphingomonas sp. AX6 TaxID=2653171 RepID=UPI0012F2DB5D|nr:hypothetical protein [Sphingomonas sp. AX6]VXC78454.1 hypothetical protein SPHINGOAX6_50029 [Sphingomonas sp. AX6]
MADPEPLRDAAKGGRGPAVQSGASDLGMFAPTPLGVAAVGGALALGATGANATAGPVSPDVGSPSVSMATGAENAFDLPAGVQGPPTGVILSETPTPTGLLSVARPVADEGAVPPSPTPGAEPLAMAPSAAELSTGDAPIEASVSPVAEVAPPSGAAASPQIIETIAAIRATADQLNEQLNGAIDALVGQVGSNLADAATAATEAIGELGSRVEAITGRIGEASDLVDNAVGGVAQIIADLSGTTDALLGTAQASVADLTGAASARLNDATDAISGTIDSTLDLTNLGGSNPAGGIATLTALLSNTDGFELGEPDMPEPVFASVGDAASVLEGIGDTVGDLSAPDLPGLLGNQGGVLGGLFDDDGDGHG